MRDHVYMYIYTHGVQNEDSDGLLRLADAQLEVGAQDILLGHLEMTLEGDSFLCHKHLETRLVNLGKALLISVAIHEVCHPL